MVHGKLIYKCRHCKNWFDGAHFPDIQSALIQILVLGRTLGNGIKAGLFLIHNCYEGHYGIGDLVCGREEE